MVPLLLLTGCASNKLKKTVWYNVTTMQENGVMGNVGTSLVFNTDSTIVVYKGVSIDTTVIVSPYIFAYGKYHNKKLDDGKRQITITATKRDGSPYVYNGEYNKKKGLMMLCAPNSKLQETYILNSEAKFNVK